MSASTRRAPVVLSVAGTDPLVGAGVVADALTIREHGAQPLAVVTATVAQDSRGVRSFAPAPLDVFAESLACALEDGRPDAVKVGMLATAEHAEVLSAALPEGTPVVLDPVLHGGRDGAPLHRTGLLRALDVLAERALVTPNADELQRWLRSDRVARDVLELAAGARALHERGAWAVLAKGGHVDPPGVDVLVIDGATHELPSLGGCWPDGDIHGTGCALSSAIAARLAFGDGVLEAVSSARSWLHGKATSVDGVTRVGCGRAQFALGARR